MKRNGFIPSVRTTSAATETKFPGGIGYCANGGMKEHRIPSARRAPAQAALPEEFSDAAAELAAGSNLSLAATAGRARSLLCSGLNLKRYERNCGNYGAASFILAASKLAEKIIKAHVETPAIQCDRLRTTTYGFYTGNPV